MFGPTTTHSAKVSAVRIQSLHNDIKEELDTIKPYLKNKDIPLDERWNVYEEVAKWLPKSTYGDGEVRYLGVNLSLYDNFHVERHQTCSYLEIYESVMDYNADLEAGQSWATKPKYTHVDEWRERVLDTGYGSFTFDW